MAKPSIWMLLGLGLLIGVPQPAAAGPSPDKKCQDTKAKEAGKKAAALLKAIGKNISKNPDTKLTANISKAESKFTKGFSKAEAKDGCITNGDSQQIEDKINAFVANVEGHINIKCGDNVQAGTEQCDGTDTAPCPGSCVPAGDPDECTCDSCGNGVADPIEECDGTDDSACPGACLGDCTCDFCGNGLRSGSEVCDGSDDSACPGICQPNCICPPPLCGNGVLEAGEQCEPRCVVGPPCGAGEICGADCQCVPNAACTCGSPTPTGLAFTISEGSGTCGSVKDSGGNTLQSLACGNGYVGGGQLGVAPPNTPVPLGTALFNAECCIGNDVVLTKTTAAETGSIRNCSEGLHCSVTTSQTCVFDVDCPASETCERCLLGGPVPVIVPFATNFSVCTADNATVDYFGSVNCSTGAASLEIPITSPTHLTGDGLKWRCVGGTNPGALCTPDRCSVIGAVCVADSDCPATETCDSNLSCVGTAVTGKACTSDAECIGLCSGTSNSCTADTDCAATETCVPQPGGSCGCPGGGTCQEDTDIQPCPICNLTTLTCNGGPNNGLPCTPAEPIGTGTLYPTSHDCPPNPLLVVAVTPNPYSLRSTTLMREALDGQFCGFCRDAIQGPALNDDGTLCFEGQTSKGLTICPDSSVLACKPATGGDISECGQAVACNSDADCFAPYESCRQRHAGAANQPTATKLTENGSPVGDMTDHAEHSGMLVSLFCIDPTFDELTDASADFPGPGAIAMPSTLRLLPSPSGAFVNAMDPLLD